MEVDPCTKDKETNLGEEMISEKEVGVARVCIREARIQAIQEMPASGVRPDRGDADADEYGGPS